MNYQKWLQIKQQGKKEKEKNQVQWIGRFFCVLKKMLLWIFL